MKKLLFLILLFTLNTYALADNTAIVAADKAFTTGNLSKLSTIYQQNKNVRVISYLYAKGMLTKNIATPAESFISVKYDDYLRIDLIHQLMIYYYKNNRFTAYIKAFNLIPITRVNLNEKCGYDLANMTKGKGQNPLLTNSVLVSNSLPQWCADLVATKFKYQNISKEERDFVLINLVLNKHSDTFNSIAQYVNASPINFYQYSNKNISDNNPNYNFVIAYKISAIAKKEPDDALNILENSSIGSNLKSIIYGYLGMQFALNQNFTQAIKMYEESNSKYLSNDELEWRTRSYLANEAWNKAINSIKDMPDALQEKNVWLYWMGKSLAQLDNDSEAIKYFKKIPMDYSYYSMLAQSELKQKTTFINSKVSPLPQNHSIYFTNASSALNLYILAQKNRSRNLASIASTEWTYAAKHATNSELVIMSNLTKKNQYYDLSIAAADQMYLRDLHLSYPTPFLAAYNKHSIHYGIAPSYALAVTRQESRFNYKVIAFDGGVGLMQIMPETAKYIARKSGSNNCYRASYDCNIKFGAWYLGSLYQKFNSNYLYATAAYNGGPNRARRWQDNLENLDAILQMELIPINITRGYVQKVLSNKAIYDSELNQKNTLSLAQYIKNMPFRHYLQEPDDDNTDAGKI